jgi:hypothetical protein
MINFLPNIIKTFSDNSQQSVGFLIKSIKADKSQVSELVKSLSNFSVGADFAPTLMRSRAIIESEFFVDIFRDVQIRFDRYFSASNSISVSLNSMIEVMSSQVAKVEKNISLLENYINNYDFISGKDDLYNDSYIENFDDFLKSNTYDVSPIPFTDRGGPNFDESGNGFIDPVVSKFKIGNGIDFINTIGYVKSVGYETNYNQYVSSITDYESLFNEKQSNVWNISVQSPTILTSIPPSFSQYIDYDYSYIVGAKTVVTINFIKEIEMDLIRINPNEYDGLQLMQVVIESANIAERIYSSNSNVPSSGYEKKKILLSPIKVNSVLDINFPLDKVKSVILIFNQSTYKKNTISPTSDEISSRLIHELLNSVRKNKKNTHSKLQDIVLEYFRKFTSIDEAKRNSYAYTDYYTYKYPISKTGSQSFLSENNNSTSLDQGDRLSSSNHLSIMVRNIVSQTLGDRFKLFDDSLFVDNRLNNRGGFLSKVGNSPNILSKNSNSLDKNLVSFADDAIMSGSSINSTNILRNKNQSVENYMYSFSLRGIQFGKTRQTSNSTNSLSTNKASFISSRIPIDGNPLAVKAKLNLEKINESKALPDFDLKEANSYEMSISIKENPTSENDWIPIISYDSNDINSEFLFFDSISKTAFLRFFPIETSIKIYSNQKLIPENQYTVNKFNKSIYINSFDPKNNYIASYSADNINFTQNYIDISTLLVNNPTLSAYSNDKNGEFFERTGSNNSIKLINQPYINHDKLQKASYSQRGGTINTIEYVGYSPVLVRFSDGSYATNLTNYKLGSFEKGEFYDTQEVLFFHNGKNIIFNKAITQPFNVIYEYLNSQIRFRLIIRNNFNNYFSSGSVDNVILKFKTKNSDHMANNLLRLG